MSVNCLTRLVDIAKQVEREEKDKTAKKRKSETDYCMSKEKIEA